MDNLEFTRQGQRELRRLLEWLSKAGVDSVTVANPYLLMWIKKNYPGISVSVSAMANVDSLNRAKFWESLGVDKITFPGPFVNRNLNLIRLMRKSLKCKMQLIANNGCQKQCPNFINHALMSCHGSQNRHKGYIFDYYVAMCRMNRLQDPVNFIFSDWIRPEDVTFYERLGIDSIKIVDRRLPTHLILKILGAYLSRSYTGNLMDLLANFYGVSFNAHKGWITKLFYLLPSFPVNPIKLLRYSKVLSKLDVFIDNKSLDGFLENIPEKCDLMSCDDCRYCMGVAAKAVKIDKGYSEDKIRQHKKVMDNLF